MTKYLTFTGPWIPKIYDRHPPPLFCSPLLPSHSLSSFVRWYRGYVASSSLHARCTPIDGRFARRAQCFPLRRRTMRRSRGFSTYPSAGKVENGVPWFGKKRLTSRQMTRLASFKGGLCILISFLWRMSLFLSLSLSGFSLFDFSNDTIDIMDDGEYRRWYHKDRRSNWN